MVCLKVKDNKNSFRESEDVIGLLMIAHYENKKILLLLISVWFERCLELRGGGELWGR